MTAYRSVRRTLANLIAMLLATLILAACCQRESSDTTQSLAREPQPLQMLLLECDDEWARSDDEFCRAVSAAWRQRLLGDESLPMSRLSTPELPVAPAPSEAEPTPWMGGT